MAIPGSGKKYFKISEVAKIIGVPSSTLRFWEKDFPQLKPIKNKKGDRIYQEKDLEILKEIKYLTKEKGLKLSKATHKIKRTDSLPDEKQALVKKLREVKELLLQLKDAMQ